jgi:LPXTG-site transpeptidase (sortase) family protein
MPPKKKKFSKRTKKFLNKIVALVFITLALLVLIGFPKFPSDQDKNPIQINSGLYSNKKSENTPVRILIPKINIDLPITEAKIINGYWELSENSASYGLGSGYPGTPSNTVIFAHAKQGLFYNLKNVKVGEMIYVFTKNKWHGYKVSKIDAVFPNQKEVIMPTKKETLTLYTCTGFYDEKRLIVTALPSK